MLEHSKQQLVAFGRKMAGGALVTGTGGNLSTFDRSGDIIAITPSGLDYDGLHSDDIVLCDRQGSIIEGDRKPSSELGFHLSLYDYRKDIGAIVHTHSTYATTLACLHMEIPAIHYLVGLAGTKVPLASYATFGTPALSQAIVSVIDNANAVLLANHGLVAVGPDIGAAFAVAEQVEWLARIYYQTLVAGKPKLLSDAQMTDVLEKLKSYGQA